MKNIFLFIMLFYGVNVHGQMSDISILSSNLANKLCEMEKKDSSCLNRDESLCLNVIFEKSRKDFDFTGKKIGFLSGSSGKKRSSKVAYFNMLKKHQENEKYPIDYGVLYVFNENQKKELNGYDAAIVYWSKFVIPIDKVIKRIK